LTQQLQPLRVVQLSDCHLFADTQGKLLGLNTQFSLDKVLELIRGEQPSPDLILATGDLSQDASFESYQRLEQALSGFPAPVYWLEGNHDKPAPMLQALDCHRERSVPVCWRLVTGPSSCSTPPSPVKSLATCLTKT